MRLYDSARQLVFHLLTAWSALFVLVSNRKDASALNMYQPSHEAELWSDNAFLTPLVDIIVRALWKLLKLAGAPIGNVLAFLLWCGISFAELTSFIFRLCRRLVRWLGASREVTFWGGNSFASKRYHLAIAFFFAASAFSAVARRIHRHFSTYYRRRNDIAVKMHDAQSQGEWANHAAQLRSLDRAHGRRKSLASEAKLFKAPVFRRQSLHLRQLFQNGDGQVATADMVRCLRDDLVRRLGNMQDTAIYDYYGKIPEPIGEYITEVQRCLRHISFSENLSDEQKLNFLQETRHAFGRTALLLSGGGSLGCYHLVSTYIKES